MCNIYQILPVITERLWMISVPVIPTIPAISPHLSCSAHGAWRDPQTRHTEGPRRVQATPAGTERGRHKGRAQDGLVVAASAAGTEPPAPQMQWQRWRRRQRRLTPTAGPPARCPSGAPPPLSPGGSKGRTWSTLTILNRRASRRQTVPFAGKGVGKVLSHLPWTRSRFDSHFQDQLPCYEVPEAVVPVISTTPAHGDS